MVTPTRRASSTQRDTGVDVGVGSDAGCDPVVCRLRHIECVPMSGTTGSGLTLTSLFAVAWRFQVPSGPALITTQAGILYRPTVTTGSLFAAIVQLSGPDASPKTTLTPSDVLVSAISSSWSGTNPQIVAFPLSAKLAPGWYAVVFGTDQLGASNAQGSIEKMGKAMMCENGQHPMSLRQTGEVIMQAADPYIFVDFQ
jgi:hypothetical protein